MQFLFKWNFTVKSGYLGFQFLFKKQLVLVGVAFILSHIFLDMHSYGCITTVLWSYTCKTLPVSWLVFVTFFVSHVMYCGIIFEKKIFILKIRTCIEILAYNGSCLTGKC